ncbi:MAG: hypothetical protein LBC87_07285 [Fibromonadaceae bacterium]|jgi:hypothetical protein|nr:hypothetical protein [Fibromonadaceae bacterium]
MIDISGLNKMTWEYLNFNPYFELKRTEIDNIEIGKESAEWRTRAKGKIDRFNSTKESFKSSFELLKRSRGIEQKYNLTALYATIKRVNYDSLLLYFRAEYEVHK